MRRLGLVALLIAGLAVWLAWAARGPAATLDGLPASGGERAAAPTTAAATAPAATAPGTPAPSTAAPTAPASAPPPVGGFAGRVVDGTGAPRAGATVGPEYLGYPRWPSSGAVTDGDGHFKITPGATRPMRLVASHPFVQGAASVDAETVPDPGAVIIVLDGPPAGTVEVLLEGEPGADAPEGEVRLFPSDPAHEPRAADRTAAGRFMTARVPPGPWKVRFVGAGLAWTPTAAPVDVVAGARAEVRLMITRSPTLHGVVVDAAGAPLAYADVCATTAWSRFTPGDKAEHRVRSWISIGGMFSARRTGAWELGDEGYSVTDYADSEGHFEIPGLGPGPVRLSVAFEGATVLETTATPGPEPHRFAVSLPPADLIVQVVGEAPVGLWWLEVGPPGSDAVARRDTGPEFRFRGLTSGLHVACVTGSSPPVADIARTDVRPGADQRLVLTPTPAARLGCRVVADADGAPLARSRLELVADGVAFLLSDRSREGRHKAIVPAGPGQYLRASAEGFATRDVPLDLSPGAEVDLGDIRLSRAP